MKDAGHRPHASGSGLRGPGGVGLLPGLTVDHVSGAQLERDTIMTCSQNPKPTTFKSPDRRSFSRMQSGKGDLIGPRPITLSLGLLTLLPPDLMSLCSLAKPAHDHMPRLDCPSASAETLSLSLRQLKASSE